LPHLTHQPELAQKLLDNAAAVQEEGVVSQTTTVHMEYLNRDPRVQKMVEGYEEQMRQYEADIR
jgi:hypothetical protein